MRFVLLIAAAAFLAVTPACADDAQTLEKVTVVIKSSDGVSHNFNVELALTPDQQEKGLMFRTELADNAGMLFAFPEESKRAFWMRNTLVPLDMVFIKKDGAIALIHQNAVPEYLTPIPSQEPVLAVLELKGGVTEKLGIKAGDMVYNKRFFGNELGQ